MLRARAAQGLRKLRPELGSNCRTPFDYPDLTRVFAEGSLPGNAARGPTCDRTFAAQGALPADEARGARPAISSAMLLLGASASRSGPGLAPQLGVPPQHALWVLGCGTPAPNTRQGARQTSLRGLRLSSGMAHGASSLLAAAQAHAVPAETRDFQKHMCMAVMRGPPRHGQTQAPRQGEGNREWKKNPAKQPRLGREPNSVGADQEARGEQLVQLQGMQLVQYLESVARLAALEPLALLHRQAAPAVPRADRPLKVPTEQGQQGHGLGGTTEDAALAAPCQEGQGAAPLRTARSATAPQQRQRPQAGRSAGAQGKRRDSFKGMLEMDWVQGTWKRGTSAAASQALARAEREDAEEESERSAGAQPLEARLGAGESALASAVPSRAGPSLNPACDVGLRGDDATNGAAVPVLTEAEAWRWEGALPDPEEAESTRGGVSSRLPPHVVQRMVDETEAELRDRARAQWYDVALEQRQREMEEELRTSAETARWEEATDLLRKGMGQQLSVGRHLMLRWKDKLQKEIHGVLEVARSSSERSGAVDRDLASAMPALRSLGSDLLARLTLQKAVEALMLEQGKLLQQDEGWFARGALATLTLRTANPVFSRTILTAMHIGRAVELEVAFKQMKKVVRNELARRERVASAKRAEAAGGQKRSVEEEAMLVALMRQTGMDPWSDEVLVQVGAFLMKLLVDTADVPYDLLGRPTDIPETPAKAFSQDYVAMRRGPRRYGVLCWNPELSQVIPSLLVLSVPLLPYQPMLVPPRPWKRPRQGGYLTLPCSIMRTKGGGGWEQSRLLERRSYEQMKDVYQALDVLGATPWRINMRVAPVLRALWDQGGGQAGLVERAELPVAPRPPPGTPREQVWEWAKATRKERKINAERASLAADMEIKLKVLDRFKDVQRFFYPHNLDFRGRAYPMHPHLHHLGSDHCRGVLEFAEGRALGERGLFWLKVHLANVFATGGVDKRSFAGRVEFADEHMADIQQSARDPLGRGRWWMQAEDPFQCLAACFEIDSALRCPAGPEAYVCHLPVHQDGSCNGLQHYAALGRDIDGARSVNLIRGDKPGDVYSDIARIVERRIAQDHGLAFGASGATGLQAPQAGGHPRQRDQARVAAGVRVLRGHVDRKLVKQTVMTSVYGVTKIGARDQIRSRIREKGLLGTSDQDQLDLSNASSYAAAITLGALEEMFSSAREIMDWLGTCAGLIGGQNKSVHWTTPLGLPVVQPYRRSDRRTVKTSLAQLTLSTNDTRNKLTVDTVKQKSAFPPNFVHSLDSSHMMRTALGCHKRGLTFAGVHDSFWTHAGTVDEMNTILREEFVALYSEPILENLLKEFEYRYSGVEFPPLPPRGEFNLEDVLDSPYFFN